MRAQTESTAPAALEPGSGPARLRVAVVTESFLPTDGPATRAACRTLEHLARRGHDAVVICPGPAPESFAGAPVIGVRSVSYRRTPVGLPGARVLRTLAAFAPDVVHLSAPFVLGAVGATAADQLGVPSVAIFPEYPEPRGRRGRRPGSATNRVAWRWIRGVHAQADLTLASSAAAYRQLRDHSVPRVTLWEPDVDGERFTPRRRAGAAVTALRARLAPGQDTLIGTDLATAHAHGEELLRAGARLVVLGDGPTRPALQERLRPASFLPVSGDDLADACAALDVFVQHPESGGSPAGSREDLRIVRQVMSSGVPVVAGAGSPAAALIAPDLNGLVADRSEAGPRAALETLLADPDRRRWMAGAARAGIERRTWETLGDELIGHYRAVLRRRSQAA
jgi:phosphatidylinositol alpha 1,6-mannosyltransferase